MRKIVFLFSLFVLSNLAAQNKLLLYNFTDIPQTLMTNPGADVSYKWYAGIPFMSGASVNFGSTGFTANDLFANDGIDFTTKVRNVLAKTTTNDFVSLNQQLELFSGGFKIGDADKKSYLSFGLYEEFDFLSYIPKDIAILALDGNKNYLGHRFNLGDLNVKAELLSVLHFGIHKKVNDNFVIGARAKIYSSIFDASSIANSGYIYTGTPGLDAYYSQNIYSNLQLNTSGLAQYRNATNRNNIASDVKKGMLMGGNLGFGFDFGVTYYPQKDIQITGSIIDLGFISHSKNVQTYTYKGFYDYKGLVPKFTAENAAQANYKDFNKAIVLDSLQSKYTTWRPTKFNSSIQYFFGEYRSDTECNCDDTGTDSFYKNAVGAQLFLMTTPRSPLFAFTTFYRTKVTSGLQLKASYTLDSFTNTNIGLGLSTRMGPIHFYILGDNLLAYKDLSKANSLSLQLGLNIILRE